MRLHVTDRQTFKTCRRMFKYNVQERLEPIGEKYNALWFGTGIHHVLAEYYKGNPDVIALWGQWLAPQPAPTTTEDMEKIEKFTELAYGMLKGYIEFSKDDDWEILEVEKEIEVRIPGTRVNLVATLDLIVRTRGRVWVVDHKTRTTFDEPSDLELDDQMTAYLWAARQVGYEPAGAIYNQIRKKVPVDPPVLQSGGLSKAKDIDTTAEIYRNKLISLNLDLKPYAEILQKLEGNEFFRRDYIIRTKGSLDTFRKYIPDEARLMGSKLTPMFPSPEKMNCRFCDYKTLCMCESDQGDTDDMKSLFFNVVPPR